MKKITTIMVLIALFGCSKLDQLEPDPENAKAGKDGQYLSELIVDGNVTLRHEYQNGRPVKTFRYLSHGAQPIELNYEYDPTNRSVTFNEPGVVTKYFYDEENRPIRQEFSPFYTIEYLYDKNQLSRLIITLKRGSEIFGTDDYRYDYSGNKLQAVAITSTRLLESGTTVSKSNYIARWQNPFSYSYFSTEFPDQVSSFQFSQSIKAPDYNLNITPSGLTPADDISRKDLIRQNSLTFLTPSHGMLLIEQSGNNARTFLENIKISDEKLPLSYDQVIETTSNGITTTERHHFEFKYVELVAAN